MLKWTHCFATPHMGPLLGYAGARLMRERGADGAVRVDGLGLDVHRHGRGARKGQRGRAAGDQSWVQAMLQAMVLRSQMRCSPIQPQVLGQQSLSCRRAYKEET